MPPPAEPHADPTAIAHAGHRPQLDALRCFAVVGVLVTHFWQPGFTGLATAFDLGFLGVRLFFVLSGFLITGILLDARDAAEQAREARVGVLLRFYARRVLRIFPLYYLIVLGGLAIDVPRAREAWPWLLAYASNFYEALTQRSTGHYGHFWTLAVEEQFYLVWPWLVLLAPRRWRAPLMLGAVLSAIAYRAAFHDAILTELGWAALPFSSLDALAAGALLALAFREAGPARTYRILGRVVLPVGLATYLGLHWHAYLSGELHLLTAGHELSFALICCWTIAGAYRGFPGLAGRVLEAGPLVYLGRISYGIYAYHMLLPWVLPRVLRRVGIGFPDPGPARFVLAGAATVAIAAASWHLFEAPINALKRHIPYGRRRTTREAPAASGRIAG